MMTLQKFLNQLANPAMKWLLRSPFHGLASNRLLLIEFTGRKSGQIYRTPVMYGTLADKIMITTSRDYVWWRNLSGGARVRLWLRGREQTGTADVSLDRSQIEAALRVVYPNASPAMYDQMSKRNIVNIQIHLDSP